MNNSYIMKEIDKAMNFVIRKIYSGKLLIDILDIQNEIYVEIKNGNYNFYEQHEESVNAFKGILLISKKRNDIMNFKLEIRKNIWKLENNGFIIIKYVNNDSCDVDLKKEEFENFLKDESFLDIESYIILNKNSNGEDSSQGLVIIARLHEELLDESPEYEEYTINILKESKCGGCSQKSGGCSKKNGGCEGCTSCCKK